MESGTLELFLLQAGHEPSAEPLAVSCVATCKKGQKTAGRLAAKQCDG